MNINASMTELERRTIAHSPNGALDAPITYSVSDSTKVKVYTDLGRTYIHSIKPGTVVVSCNATAGGLDVSDHINLNIIAVPATNLNTVLGDPIPR